MDTLVGLAAAVLIISAVAWICYFIIAFALKKRMQSENVTDEARRNDFKSARNPFLFSIFFLVFTGPVGLIWYWALFRKKINDMFIADFEARNIDYADLM